MTRIALVVSDVDGTLVDSNYLHVSAWSEALAQGGHGALQRPPGHPGIASRSRLPHPTPQMRPQPVHHAIERRITLQPSRRPGERGAGDADRAGKRRVVGQAGSERRIAGRRVRPGGSVDQGPQ